MKYANKKFKLIRLEICSREELKEKSSQANDRVGPLTN